MTGRDPQPRPGGPPPVPSFDGEVASALRYEKGLAVKTVLALILLAAILALRVYFFG